MKKTVQVVMLPTEKAIGDSSMLYRHIIGVRGATLNESLMYSDNPTYIRNTLLMNSGKAATNAQSKSELYHLYLVSDEDTKGGDWFINLHDKSLGQYGKDQTPSQSPYVKRIIATTDASIQCERADGMGGSTSWFYPQILESFVKAYVDTKGKINEVQIEMEQIGVPEEPRFRMKLRKDNTVTIHRTIDMKRRKDLIDFMTYLEDEKFLESDQPQIYIKYEVVENYMEK